jgi:hypothetical protein
VAVDRVLRKETAAEAAQSGAFRAFEVVPLVGRFCAPGAASVRLFVESR